MLKSSNVHKIRNFDFIFTSQPESLHLSAVENQICLLRVSLNFNI